MQASHVNQRLQIFLAAATVEMANQNYEGFRRREQRVQRVGGSIGGEQCMCAKRGQSCFGGDGIGIKDAW